MHRSESRDRVPDGAGPRFPALGRQPRAASTSTRGTRAATTSTGPTTCTSISTRCRRRELRARAGDGAGRARRAGRAGDGAAGEDQRLALELHVYVPIGAGRLQKEVWRVRQAARAGDLAAEASRRSSPPSIASPTGRGGACWSITTRTPGGETLASRLLGAARTRSPDRVARRSPGTRWSTASAPEDVHHRNVPRADAGAAATCGSRCWRTRGRFPLAEIL